MHPRDLYTPMINEEKSPKTNQGAAPTPSRSKLPPLKNVPSHSYEPNTEGLTELRGPKPGLRSLSARTSFFSNKGVLNTINVARKSIQETSSVTPEKPGLHADVKEDPSSWQTELSKLRENKSFISVKNVEEDSVKMQSFITPPNSPPKKLGEESTSSLFVKTPEGTSTKIRSLMSPMSPNTPGIIHDSRLPPSKTRFKFEDEPIEEEPPQKTAYNDLRVILCYRGQYDDKGFPEKWIKVPKKGLYKFDLVDLIDPAANQQKIVMENAAWRVLSRVSTQTKVLYLKLYSCITAILCFLPKDNKTRKHPEVNIHIPTKGMSKADFCILIQPAEDPDNLIVEGWDKAFTSLETFEVYSLEWIVRDERVVMITRRPKTHKKPEEASTKKFSQLRLAFTKRIRRTSL